MSSTSNKGFGPGDVARALAARVLPSRFRISGTSMEPTLRAGAVVEIMPTQPTVGDILVFTQMSGRVIAHRVVSRGAEGYLTAGDAQPLTVEYVPSGDVLGTVRTIRPQGGAGPARTALLQHAHAIMFGHLHGMRRWTARVRSWLAVGTAAQQFEEPVFAALLDALQAYEERNEVAFTAALATVSALPFLTCVKKHHCSSFLAHAFSLFPNAALAQPELRAAVVRVHLASTRQNARVQSELAFMLAVLQPHGVTPTLLKGAARIQRGAATFECGYSGDIDILCSPADAQRIRAILRAAGYTYTCDAQHVTLFERRHHHAAPLVRTAGAVPIEIHTALNEPDRTTAALTAASMRPFTVMTSAANATVGMLDIVGSALHLAYHARAFTPVRDVLLLGRLLRTMSDIERTTFNGILQREKRDGTRLHAVYEQAARFGGLFVPSTNATARYAAWVHVRESLHPRVAHRVQVLEAWYGRAPRARAQVANGLHRFLRQCGQWLIAGQLGPRLRGRVGHVKAVFDQAHSAKFP